MIGGRRPRDVTHEPGRGGKKGLPPGKEGTEKTAENMCISKEVMLRSRRRQGIK